MEIQKRRPKQDSEACDDNAVVDDDDGGVDDGDDRDEDDGQPSEFPYEDDESTEKPIEWIE